MARFSKRLMAAALEPLMLSLLAEGPKYGYQIIKRVRDSSGGKIRWTNGMLYPLLHQLEFNGLVKSYWEASEKGPDRKYYRITSKGKRALDKSRAEWISMTDILTAFWNPDIALGT